VKNNVSNIDKLEELTKKLPPLTDLVLMAKNSITEYKVENGTCIGLALLNTEKVAVQKAVASAGTIFPRHTHEEHEFIILVEGEMINNDGHKFFAPDVIHLNPNESHEHTFVTNCLVIAITVPASKGYPHAT
jgi:quercetin dioxygenase-like cupin family protein